MSDSPNAVGQPSEQVSPVPGAVQPAQPGAATPVQPGAATPAEHGVEQPLKCFCSACGAQVAYAPGTESLTCPRCGHVEQLADMPPIVEHSFDEWAALKAKPVATIGEVVLQCDNCGATTETDQLAGTCRFCRGPLVQVSSPQGVIAPEAVVPFHVNRAAATEAFRGWARTRHFAPRALKQVSSTDSLAGTYVPHWTFDARTSTDYEGQRGEHYYVTESYQTSDGKGGSRTQTRQVQHTRWHYASGQVQRDFDDLLVPASNHVPAKRLSEMGPWKLKADAEPFQPSYLAGFAAVRYDVDPDAGLDVAQARMRKRIGKDCANDIGGDEQRVAQMNVHYAALMFKLVLLPMWIATYATAGKTFTAFVNANTGEVVGERPYSKIKIAVLVLVVLLAIAAIVTAIVVHRR